MVDFWQALEAEATLLDVELLHAQKNPSGAASAEAQTGQWLESEYKLIKPAVPGQDALQTKTGLLWLKKFQWGYSGKTAPDPFSTG
ncbi:MAG: hypothetical protein ABUS54_11830 [Actinomycetota bacterium]